MFTKPNPTYEGYMPNKTKLNLKDLNVTSFKTTDEKDKFIGGYISAHVNTCHPCQPGGTNNNQCTVTCNELSYVSCPTDFPC